MIIIGDFDELRMAKVIASQKKKKSQGKEKSELPRAAAAEKLFFLVLFCFFCA